MSRERLYIDAGGVILLATLLGLTLVLLIGVAMVLGKPIGLWILKVGIVVAPLLLVEVVAMEDLEDIIEEGSITAIIFIAWLTFSIVYTSALVFLHLMPP